MEQTRLKYFDGLRGVAALAVMWFHLYTQNGAADAVHDLPYILPTVSVWGRFGVQLFFALSGFVLAYTLLVVPKIFSVSDVPKYFFKRSIRLDPTYWVILIIYILATPLLLKLLYHNNSTHQISFEPTMTNITNDFIYFLPLWGNVHIVPVVWTLILEVQLYMFFSIILLLGSYLSIKMGYKLLQTRMIVIIVFSILGSFWPLGLLPYMNNIFLPHLNNFFVGVLACAIIYKLPFRLILLIVVISSYLVGFYLTKSSYNVAILFSFLIFILPLFFHFPVKLMESKMFQFMGKCSYSSYLLHPLVGGLTVEILKYLYPKSGFTLLFVFIGVISTILISEIIWLVIEKPSIRWSKKVILNTK